MLIRYGWIACLVWLAACVAAAAPGTPALGEVTNTTVNKVQPEAPADTTTDDLLRDPFWPVGYSPVTKTVPAAVSQQTSLPAAVAEDTLKRALSLIRVGGIIRRGTKYFATVNGTMVEPGDEIPVMVEGNWVVFTVRYIDMKRLKIEPAKQ